MYKEKKLYVNSQPVFKHLLPAIRNNYVAEGGSLANNQWTYISSDKSVRINSASGVQAFLTIPLGDLKQGDIIDINFESIVHSGTNGINLYIQRYVNDTWSNVISSIFNATDYYVQNTFKHMVLTNDKYQILLGVGSSAVQEFSLRSILITLKQVPTVDLVKINEFKSVMLQKTAGTWSARTDAAGADVTLSLVDNYEMQVTFNEPFKPTEGVGSLKPIVATAIDYVANGYKYEIRITYTTKNGFKFKIYDSNATSDTPLNLITTVEDGVALYFIATSYYYDLLWL